MKLASFLLAALTLIIVGCKTTPRDQSSAFLMDSDYENDRNVTVVRDQKIIPLAESMKNFEDNPNITQTDIDVAKGIENKDVHLVKRGETLRIAEPDAKRE